MGIGVIGTGSIASALVRGIAKDGHDVVVSERSASHSSALAAEFDNVSVAANQAVVDQSDLVFLGLMAEVASGVLKGLAFRPEQSVISLMAGASLDEVTEMVAPAGTEALMLPFPGIAQGGSPILALGNVQPVHTLFGHRNTVFEVASADEMAAYLCAQAVLSPAACLVGDASAWLGERVADAGQGEAFLRALVASSLRNTPCADLVEALNTPGGYNQRLRIHMEDGGMGSMLAHGLNALEAGE